jgi:hypothetical protein
MLLNIINAPSEEWTAGAWNLLQKAPPRNNFVRAARPEDSIFVAFHA